MGKLADVNHRKVREIPKHMPFVPLTLELLKSDAWRGMSINCRRLIDFLLIEHMNHAGLENGDLIATYKQLEKFGVNRISKAIKEAEDRGLIIIEHGSRKSLNESYPNRFQLTFLKYKDKNSNNVSSYYAPTNQWKRYNKK